MPEKINGMEWVGVSATAVLSPRPLTPHARIPMRGKARDGGTRTKGWSKGERKGREGRGRGGELEGREAHPAHGARRAPGLGRVRARLRILAAAPADGVRGARARAPRDLVRLAPRRRVPHQPEQPAQRAARVAPRVRHPRRQQVLPRVREQVRLLDLALRRVLRAFFWAR